METEKSATIETKIENPNVTPDVSKIATLAGQAKAVESEGAGFMQPGLKKKRGRPRKTPGEQKAEALGLGQPAAPGLNGSGASAPPPIPSKKIAEPAVKLLSKLGAGVAGHPKAEMTTDELEAISEACGMVLDKWMPVVAGQYGPELFLTMALASWGTRVYAIRKVVEQEQAEREQAKRHMQAMTESGPEIKTDVGAAVPVPGVVKMRRPDMSGVDLNSAEKEFGPVPQ